MHTEAAISGLLTTKSINNHCELQKAYDGHNSAYHKLQNRKKRDNVYQPHSNNILQIYNSKNDFILNGLLASGL
jgi:hypothetical protein